MAAARTYFTKVNAQQSFSTKLPAMIPKSFVSPRWSVGRMFVTLLSLSLHISGFSNEFHHVIDRVSIWIYADTAHAIVFQDFEQESFFFC
jgi:hypothetical protein